MFIDFQRVSELIIIDIYRFSSSIGIIDVLHPDILNLVCPALTSFNKSEGKKMKEDKT